MISDSLLSRACAACAPERTVTTGLDPARSIRTSSELMGTRDTPLVSSQFDATSQKPSLSLFHEIVGEIERAEPGGPFAARRVSTSRSATFEFAPGNRR